MIINEEEAQADLMNMIGLGEQPMEEVAEEPQEAIAEQTPVEQVAQPQVDTETLLNAINTMGARLQEMEMRLSQPQMPQAPQPEQPPMLDQATRQQAQRELGLDAMQEQLNKQQAFYDEQQAKIAFNNAWNDFTKTHPNVTQQELYNWAVGNKLADLVATPNGWEVLYKAMQFQAQPKSSPDPITPIAKSNNNENSAFERKKRGEEVPEIELGMELLNMSNR